MKDLKITFSFFLITLTGNLSAIAQQFGAEQVIIDETFAANGPTDVIAIDLDGDEDKDVVFTSGLGDLIAWYKNDGNGKFSDHEIISEQADGPIAIGAADFDGDGDMDLVCASVTDNKLAWYENDGTGKFGEEHSISTSLVGATELITKDIDCDGQIDIIVLSSYDYQDIFWFKNQGQGDAWEKNTIITNSFGVNAIFVVDLYGDGHQDIFAAYDFRDKLVWLKNNGSGSFSEPNFIDQNIPGIKSLYAADLDADGDRDIIYACGSPYSQAFVAFNSGDEIFTSKYALNPTIYGIENLYISDIDGDEDLDILAASSTENSIYCFKNYGNGYFSTAKIISSEANHAQRVMAADLDGDGLEDAISASWSDDKIAWYKNLGNMEFQTNSITTNTISNLSDILTLDIDLDGDKDVFSASQSDNKLSLYINLGNGNFSAQQIIDNNAKGAVKIDGGDINGDDIHDIIIASQEDNTISWYECDGFGNVGEKSIINESVMGLKNLLMVDLNDDYQVDVIAYSNQTKEIIWFENLGNGNFSDKNIIYENGPNYGRSLLAADLDNDLDKDLVFSSYDTNSSLVFINDNNGNFEKPFVLDPNKTTPDEILLIDLDLDNKIDIISTANEHNQAGDINWYRNEGNLFFSEANKIGEIESNSNISSGDLDGDGDYDIVTGGDSYNKDHYIYWFENNGAQSFNKQLIHSGIESHTIALLTADLDEDGDLDVLNGSAWSDKIAWFENLTYTTSGIQKEAVPASFCIKPNPTKDLFEINYQSAEISMATAFQVLSTTGKLIRKGQLKLNSSSTQIDLGSMPSGLYFIRIQNEKGSWTKSLVME